MTSTGSPADAALQVSRIADEFFAWDRRWSQTVGARGGWDYETPDDHAARHRREDDWLRVLRNLEGVLPMGSPAWAAHGMLRQELEASVASRIARFELWDVNQMTGWHLAMANVASSVSVQTADDRDAARRRFLALADVVASRIEDLRRGMAAGYTAARQVVQRVIQQIDALIAGDALDSAARRADDAAFATSWRELMARDVRPALQRYRDFLADTYAAVARADGALAALPHGEAVYRAEVFRYTSLDLAPEGVLEGAEDEIAELDAHLAPLLAKLYPGVSLGQAKLAMREDPNRTHQNRAAMIDHARGVIDKVKPQLPRFFLHVPEVPLIVEPMTPVEERIGASGYYQSPELGAPGRFVLNTAHANQCGRWETTCSAVHEGYPGHHFERIYGDWRSARHPATRELQTQAFREGWAFYAEWLANEMDVYATDAELAGHLMHMLEVWVGLVSDVLFHMGRITREQAIEMLVRRAGRLPHVAEARADRYIAAPGQVTSYMLGYREVRQYRRDAQLALGDRFDVRLFHDVLLRDGPITLPMQRAKVDGWIEETRHADVR